MKKSIVLVFCFLFFVCAASAARLFEYRGSFPAKRNSETKVSNYVLLKKGANVEFALTQKDESLPVKAVVSKVCLTSDAKISIANRKGIDAFMVPESGIYEVTISPVSDIPQDINFILSIYEREEPIEEAINTQVKNETIVNAEKESQIQDVVPESADVPDLKNKDENSGTVTAKDTESSTETTKETDNLAVLDESVVQEKTKQISDDDLLFGSANSANAVAKSSPSPLINPLKSLPENANFALQSSFSAIEKENDKYSAWPHSVTWDEDGTLWALDSQKRRILHFKLSGTLCMAFGNKGVVNGELGLPSAITVLKGRLYVSDYSNHALHVYEKSGSWVKSLKPDREIGLSLTFPGSLCIRHDEMWLPDKGSSGILCFDLKGNFLGTFESNREAPIESPLSVRANDKYLFIMQENGILKIFNPMGTLEKSLNSECSEVLGFDADPWGGFWVCDGGSGTVKRFDMTGKQLLVIKSPENLDEEWLPTSVSVRADGKIAITDANNKMIHVFSVK